MVVVYHVRDGERGRWHLRSGTVMGAGVGRSSVGFLGGTVRSSVHERRDFYDFKMIWTRQDLFVCRSKNTLFSCRLILTVFYHGVLGEYEIVQGTLSGARVGKERAVDGWELFDVI